MEQIETLTLDDMPAFWKPKVTIARARRMALVSRIREELDRSFFVMSWNYEGLSNQEFAEARAMFPTQIKVRCLKKTQFAKAAEGTGFEEWAKQLVGHNCFIFVAEDTDLKETITAYLKMSKKFNRDQAMAESWEKMKGKMKSGVLKTSMGGVMRDEWNIITAEELPKYKDFPTKLELIAKVAGAIKQVPQKLAVCTNQLPQKTAIGIKKIVEKMEEEGKATVGDVAV